MSVESTNLERDVFEAVSIASAAYRLTQDETDRILFVINQMINHRKIHIEELLQIEEALPGTFRHAANAMGVTLKELGISLERSEIMAEEFLPLFAQELRSVYGAQCTKTADRAGVFATEVRRLGDALRKALRRVK